MPHSIREKLRVGGVWAFSGKVVSIIAALAVNALLARVLSHDEMGAYFLTLSLVSFAAAVAQLGLTQTIIRLVSESTGTGHPGRARQSVYMVLRIAAISVVAVAGMLAFGGGKYIAENFFRSSVMAQVTGLAAVWVVIFLFQHLIAEIYRGFHDIKLATLFGGVLTSVLSMLLFFVLWVAQGHGSLKEVMWLTLIAGCSSVLFSSALLWNKLAALPSTGEDGIGVTEVLRLSWPLWATNLTVFALTQADLWIIGFFRSSEDVAIYGMATRMVALVTMPLMVINAVVSPMIAEMYFQGKQTELERTLRVASTAGFLLAILVGVPFIFAGGHVLGLIFGGFYVNGGVILAILSIGQLVNVLTGSCGVALMMTGHQLTMMLITLVSGLVSVLAACLLAKDFAGEGVAAAMAFGMLVQNAASLYFARNKIGIWTHFDPALIKVALHK